MHEWVQKLGLPLISRHLQCCSIGLLRWRLLCLLLLESFMCRISCLMRSTLWLMRYVFHFCFQMVPVLKQVLQVPPSHHVMVMGRRWQLCHTRQSVCQKAPLFQDLVTYQTCSNCHTLVTQTSTSTPMTSTHKLNPASPVFVPQTVSGHIEGGTKVGMQPNGPGTMDSVVGGCVAHKPQVSEMMNRFSEVLTDQRNHLPEVSISKFTGDPLEYSSFIRSFESRVASRTSDNSERLFYLEQFTSGVPQDLVRSCMHLPADIGYTEARKCLERRFGDKFLLASFYLKKLESLPEIRNNDGKRFDEFTTFLIGCRNAMLTSCSIMELDFPSSLKLVVSTLPGYFQHRWSREADSILHHEDGSVTFNRLVAFLDRENSIKLNPVFGKMSISVIHSDHIKSGASQSQSKKKTTSAAIVAKSQFKASGASSSVPTQWTFCPFQHPFNSAKSSASCCTKIRLPFW